MTNNHKTLEKARKRAGFATKREAVEAFGWNYATYAGHENGSRGLTPDTAMRYAEAFDVSVEVLLYGDEAGASSPRNLDMVMVKALNLRTDPADDQRRQTMVAAQDFGFAPAYVLEMTDSSGDDLAIISMQGASMAPTFAHGDQLLIDKRNTDLEQDGLFAIRFGDSIHIKRVGRNRRQDWISMTSDAAQQNPIEAPISEVRVVGRVIWCARRVM